MPLPLSCHFFYVFFKKGRYGIGLYVSGVKNHECLRVVINRWPLRQLISHKLAHLHYLSQKDHTHLTMTLPRSNDSVILIVSTF